MLPGYPLGKPYKQLNSRALALLDRFGLSTKKSVKIETLSGGEAQRTGICRALINQPDILIADEPTANLDTELSRDFMGMLQDVNQSGKTIIIASHDPVIIESPMVDCQVSMRDGHIEEPG